MYLRGAVPGSSRGPASLAVVAVDDAQIVARAVVSLAVSCAAEGKQVVVADLSGGAYLARLLGVSDPGIHNVSRNGANLVLVLPEPEDVAPVGPVPSGASPAVPAQADAALVTACSSADLLLTLATLDPAFGGDHLGTWATNAVAVVTAGESSVEKILRRRRDDTARRNAPGFRRPDRSGQERREPRRDGPGPAGGAWPIPSETQPLTSTSRLGQQLRRVSQRRGLPVPPRHGSDRKRPGNSQLRVVERDRHVLDGSCGRSIR